MAMRLLITNSGMTTDITNLFSQMTWSGDYQQCCRTLEFSVISSPSNQIGVPKVKCELGYAVRLYRNTQLLFEGWVHGREKSTADNVITYTAYDRGYYLNRNKVVEKAVNTTPETWTHYLCQKYGVKVGSIATTGFKFSRNFLGGETLYECIQTGYTLAGAKSKKRYQIRFTGDSLNVFEKCKNANTLVIKGGVNLMDATISESVEKMVNQVDIYDKDDKFVKSLKNKDAIKLYGLMRGYLKQSDKKDSSAEAQRTLDDNGVERKVTINGFGNVNSLTGTTVIVQEPYTGLNGLFWIDNDTHTWKNGMYLNKLTLNFRNIMDETEAGTKPEAESESSTKTKQTSSTTAKKTASSKKKSTKKKFTKKKSTKKPKIVTLDDIRKYVK